MASERTQLFRELGREPTLVELAASLDEDPATVEFITEVSRETLSLDSPLTQDETGMTLGDTVSSDPWSSDPAMIVDGQAGKAEVLDWLAALPERYRDVLWARFGFEDGDEKTLEEVGQRYGLTRERIRQIEALALNSLGDHVVAVTPEWEYLPVPVKRKTPSRKKRQGPDE